MWNKISACELIVGQVHLRSTFYFFLKLSGLLGNPLWRRMVAKTCGEWMKRHPYRVISHLQCKGSVVCPPVHPFTLGKCLLIECQLFDRLCARHTLQREMWIRKAQRSSQPGGGYLHKLLIIMQCVSCWNGGMCTFVRVCSVGSD